MNTQAIHIISASLPWLSERMPELAAAFYEDLFATAPGVRPLFPDDLTMQRRHLATALMIVARNIDALDALEGPLGEMGDRHAKYGARPEHYPVVRDVLLGSMGRIFADRWSEPLRDAWFDAISRVSAAMLRGAARAELREMAEAAAKRAG